MKNKIIDGISWIIAAVLCLVIIAMVLGAVFYAINWLLAYALDVPMLEYVQLSALGLALVFIKIALENIWNL